MKPLFCLLLIPFLFISCLDSPEKEIVKEGLTFTLPAGWKMVNDDIIEGQGHFIALEKRGFSSSGLIAITWINEIIDLDNWLELYMDALGDNIIYKNSNLTYDEPRKGEYNGIETTSVNFTVKIIGIGHQGVIHAFYGNARAYIILQQEAVADNYKNKNGFETFEKSFDLGE